MTNNDVMQAAVQTFCIVPEVYQQLMRQAGGEFPDELVSEVKSNPQEAMAAISEDQDLLKGIVALYQENSEAIDSAAASVTSQKQPLFKKGGKLYQAVQRFGGGGATDKNKLDLTKYNKTISAKGDTTEVKPYRERTDIRIARKNGPVIYQSMHKSWMDTYVDPSRGSLTGVDRILYGNPDPVPEDVKSNWDAIHRNHQNDPNVLDKSKKSTKTNSKPNFVPAIGSLFGGLARPGVIVEDIKI